MNRIFILIGIINQLSTTKANRTLSELDLPMAQLSLLSHFSFNPGQGWTVTRLADAFEMNQPAMTKTTQRLLKKGYLEMRQDEKDRRIKTFYINKKGLETLSRAWAKLAPVVESVFSDWDKGDLSQLEGLLERLKIKLDENRN